MESRDNLMTVRIFVYLVARGEDLVREWTHAAAVRGRGADGTAQGLRI